jgi:hypothetical protein
MRELLSKRHWAVDLGPLLEPPSVGPHVLNMRTDARSRGIQELIARRPWASTTQMQAYLEGFDKGEQFALDKLRSHKPEPANVGASSVSQLTSADSG